MALERTISFTGKIENFFIHLKISPFLKLLVANQSRWRSHDETYNSETSALSISPDLILPEFQLRNHKLIDRQFTLSTGCFKKKKIK